MPIQLTYRSLFEIRVLHHYYLDRGNAHYAAMTPDEQLRIFQQYRIARFCELVPAPHTLQLIKDHRLILKKFDAGLLLGAKENPDQPGHPLIDIETDLSFQFYLHIYDPNFFNYSDLPVDPPSNEIYRLTNQGQSLPPNGSLELATADTDPDHGIRYLGAADRVSLATIDPMPERSTLPFAVIDIVAGRDSSDPFALFQTDGSFPTADPVFNLRIRNRQTDWKYIYREDQVVSGADDVELLTVGNPRVLVSKSSLPLTARGSVDIQKDGQPLPNPDARIIKPDGGRIFSEIYL